jgi:hypothetical protein
LALVLRQACSRAGQGEQLELYFGATSGDLFGSGDAGATWTTVATRLPPVFSVVAIERVQRERPSRSGSAVARLIEAQRKLRAPANRGDFCADPTSQAVSRRLRAGGGLSQVY